MLVSGNYRDVRVNDRFNVVGTGVFAGKGHGKVIPAHPLVVDQFGRFRISSALTSDKPEIRRNVSAF